MKKIFITTTVFFLLSTIFMPVLAGAQGIVQCGNTGEPCGISDFFSMIGRIYEFIVKSIATPLAILALSIGGIFMLISAGNPNLLGTGKKIVYAAIIGLVLVWASWLIIDFVLTTLGAPSGQWSNP